ncbi:MAG: glycosyl hydrolase, partial [Psychroserpens sp.]
MRPLFFEEPDNPKLFDYSEAYLWGKDILVAPILNAGQTSKEVYFPKNSNWFDFYTDEKIEGGQTKTVQTKDNSIPTFVRGGSFIPTAKLAESTKLLDQDYLELHYFFDDTVNETESKFYNDNNDVDALDKGFYEVIEYEANYKGNKLNFEFELENGTDFNQTDKNIELIVHNIETQPKRIKINGKKVPVKWDSISKRLTIQVLWKTTSEAKEITIKLNKTSK